MRYGHVLRPVEAEMEVKRETNDSVRKREKRNSLEGIQYSLPPAAPQPEPQYIPFFQVSRTTFIISGVRFTVSHFKFTYGGPLGLPLT